MTEQSKTTHEIGFEKASVTAGLALIIWSFFIAISSVSNPPDLIGSNGFVIGFVIVLALVFMPLIGAYLVINSSINLLRAIRDGE